MPVTYDNSAKGIQTTTASMTIALTIAANAVLLVGVGTYDAASGNRSISSVIANGTTMTQLRRIASSLGSAVHLFGLTAPPSGVVSISANVVGAAMLMQVYAASYLGAKAAGPFGDVQGTTATGVANIAISLSTSTTDRVIFFSSSFNNLSATNSTIRQIDAPNFQTFWSDTAGPAAAVSLSATGAGISTFIAFTGLNIIFSAAAATGPTLFNKTLLGVGY